MIARGPADLRSLFTLFLLYEQSSGLDGLVQRIDLTGFDRRKIYRSVLGRNPESVELCRTPPDYRADTHFLEALRSREFQKSLIKLLLRAFPERRRIIFIHIPKCAGTDLIAKLAPRYPSINNTLTSEMWTSETDLFTVLKRIVSEAYCSNAVFVYGHIGLSWLISQDLIRGQDDCFTIVRDPVEMVLSHVNYILKRIRAADSLTAPDARQWTSELGLAGPPAGLSEPEAVDLAGTILRNQKLTPGNITCRQLGAATGEPNASTAVDNLILSNIEITDTTRYDRWTRKKFGTSRSTRLNRSEAILKAEDLSGADREYIAGITAEDRKLYGHIMSRLGQTDSLSIHGGDL